VVEPDSAPVPGGRGPRWVYLWLLAWAFLGPAALLGLLAAAQLQRCDQFAEADWSPDGRQVAYACNRDASQSADIYVMNADGGGQSNLTNNQGQRWDTSPEWSPDGQRLKFWGDGEHVSVVDQDGREPQDLTAGLNVAVHPGAWSPDGRQIAFNSSTGYEDDLYLVGADGSGLRNLTRELGGRNTEPAWSPDGQQIAFIHNAEAGAAVHVVNADGAGLRQLLGGLDNASVTWSPGGRQLAIVSLRWVGGERDYDGDLYLAESDGSRVQKLASLPDITDVAWAPDGQRLLFSSSSGQAAELYVTGGADAGLQKLADASGDQVRLSGAWSPQGGQIAVIALAAAGRAAISVGPADGGGLRQIAAFQASRVKAEWLPDGQRLALQVDPFYLATMWGAGVVDSSIYVINADGTGLRNVRPALFPAHLLPLLLHLGLLAGLLSPARSARWHTGQALILAGLSVLAALFLISEPRSPWMLACGWFSVNGAVCVGGAVWGLRQIRRGENWLMRRLDPAAGRPPPPAAPPPRRIGVNGLALILAGAAMVLALLSGVFPFLAFVVVSIVAYAVPLDTPFRDPVIDAAAGAILLALLLAIGAAGYGVAARFIRRS
jgi:Tol biopolymer transport system component